MSSPVVLKKIAITYLNDSSISLEDHVLPCTAGAFSSH
jgi:hypothetical protein